MIKDQCNNCKKNGTANCGQTIIFNSLPCENYVRKLDLSKSTDKVASSPVANPSSQPTTPYSPQLNNSTNTQTSESSFWKSLFSFNGRIRRTRYWLTMICTNLLFLPANLAGDNMSEGVAVFTLLIFIPALWILLANVVKRCHDLGKSGFFALLMLIPLVNIVVGIYLAFFQGDLNDNEYGPSPY